ncbi:hypothetical protein [Pseudoalteromonas rubra]|uniref:hypothetical protein n=1 Tax=Pseudoalteromonas rubra TaxID=43658 RepID=UPI002DBDC22E|nr:hypothetical protein [Pseudoalteromonas rubra]MEC4091619.1 hypothetical protein [Pseudoalteromonas rubra]
MSGHIYNDTFRRNKTDSKTFVDLFKPVITWALNNKNPLFEQVDVQFNFSKERGGNDQTLHVTVFFSEGGNEGFTFYSWKSESDLKMKREQLKKVFKSKTMAEFAVLSEPLNSLNL